MTHQQQTRASDHVPIGLGIVHPKTPRPQTEVVPKGLCQILRMEPIFVNRASTNHEVLRANLTIRARNDPNSAVCRISDTLKKQNIAQQVDNKSHTKPF